MQLEKSIMGAQETLPMPRLLTLAAESVKEIIYSIQTFLELPECLVTTFVNYDCGYSSVTGFYSNVDDQIESTTQKTDQ